MTEQDSQTAVNALKNKYHLSWCYQTDLIGYGGINWFAPWGAFIGGTDALPETIVGQLEELIQRHKLQMPTYHKPLQKIFSVQTEEVLPEDGQLAYDCIIPRAGHPGAFGAVRKNHIHEGVDLYAMQGDPVFAMTDGVVVNAIEHFTGPGANMPWWNKTSAVAIQDDAGVWIYGEITVDPLLRIGQSIRAGTQIGQVETVLKTDKGRPMAMLHLERYVHGTTESIGLWECGAEQPANLLDPTPLLIMHLGLLPPLC